MKKYVLTAITLMLGLGTFFLVGYVIDGSENDSQNTSENDSQTTSLANQNASKNEKYQFNLDINEEYLNLFNESSPALLQENNNKFGGDLIN